MSPDPRQGRIRLAVVKWKRIVRMSSNSQSYLDWADKGRSSFLIYLIGFILIVLCWLLLGEFVSAPIQSLVQAVFGESIAGTLLTDFSSFLPAFIVIPLATKYLLGRPWWSFGFPNLKPDFSVFALAVLVSLAVSLFVTLGFGLTGLLQIKLQLPNAREFLIVLAISGVGFLVQTSAEEFLFRGYLTQFARRYFTSPLLFIGIPSLLFAAPHFANVESASGHWYVLLPYLAPGVLFGWLAYRTGALWVAIGLHWANNLGNMVLVGTDIDSLPTVAPIVVSQPTYEMATIMVLVSTVLIFAIMEFLLRNVRRQNIWH
jgi:membrane protease YdiL (CAAX protease family)